MAKLNWSKPFSAPKEEKKVKTNLNDFKQKKIKKTGIATNEKGVPDVAYIRQAVKDSLRRFKK